MLPAALQDAIGQIPPGAWAVGVSGGADSVALLRLALTVHPGLRLVAVHLDHETRQGASAADARFVETLCRQLDVECIIETRSAVEADLSAPPANRSARYRACRQALFARVIDRHGLSGVLLAHHADDQAETVLHRLLRGSGAVNLGGMSADARIGGVRVLRPLLGVPGNLLRDYLRAIGQPWREDVSNASDAFARNRHRRLLRRFGGVSGALLDVGASMRALRGWTRAVAPDLPATIRLEELARWPALLQGEALRQWLIRAGAPAGAVERRVIQRLLAMATDAASPPRQDFPGGIRVHRRQGVLQASRCDS